MTSENIELKRQVGAEHVLHAPCHRLIHGTTTDFSYDRHLYSRLHITEHINSGIKIQMLLYDAHSRLVFPNKLLH